MITCLGLGSGMDSSLCMGPLGHFPIRVWWEILSPESFHYHPWGGWVGFCEPTEWVLSSSALSLPQAERPSQFLLHPKHPSSRSDPVTPGLVSGLGTVDVGKVPPGSWSFATAYTLMPADLSCLLPSSWRFWSLFLRLCRKLILVRVTPSTGQGPQQPVCLLNFLFDSLPPSYQDFFLQPGRQCTWWRTS